MTTDNLTLFEEFSTPGAFTFNVPVGVSAIWFSIIGAGGSGGGQLAFPAARPGLAGGGAGEFGRRIPMKVTSGGTVSGFIGTGGAAASYNAVKGQDGTASTFGIYTANGGFGGQLSNGSGGGTAGGGFGMPHVDGSNFNNINGDPSLPECLNWNYGASGGGAHTANSTNGRPGGACEGQIAAAGGADGVSGGSSMGGGSGGGSSPYGIGGLGGVYNGTGGDASGYGGGGGGGGGLGFQVSGAGGNGYVLVEYIAPP